MGTLGFGEAMVSALAPVKAPRQTGRARVRSSAPHRTGAPVLRDSVEAGTFEHVFFVAPAKGETDRLLRAARRILDAGRQLRSEARCNGRELTPAERLLTTLTSASVRVFEEILTLSRLNKGHVFPSYDHLAQATSLGRATVARGLRILEGIGFLVRQRRFKRVEGEGPGPRYEQTSNAYRAFLPKIVQAYLPRWMRPAPIPDDELQRQADRIEDLGHMHACPSRSERAEAALKGPLAKVLARLDAALERKERESQKDPQPLLDSFIRETSGVGLTGQQRYST
ncbi:hypothetical protein TomMM35A_33630 [Sphingobium sp. TomMM35A]